MMYMNTIIWGLCMQCIAENLAVPQNCLCMFRIPPLLVCPCQSLGTCNMTENEIIQWNSPARNNPAATVSSHTTVLANLLACLTDHKASVFFLLSVHCFIFYPSTLFSFYPSTHLSFYPSTVFIFHPSTLLSVHCFSRPLFFSFYPCIGLFSLIVVACSHSVS